MLKKRSVSSSKFIQKKRKKLYIQVGGVFALLLIVFFGLALLSRIDKLAIKDIYVEGVQVISSDEVKALIIGELDQKYIGLFSKRNIVIFPKETLEQQIRNRWKRVQEVRIEREGGQGIHIAVVEEKPRYLWCGDKVEKEEQCYFLNEGGYLFAESPQFSGAVFVKFFGSLGTSTTELLGSRFLEQDEFSKLTQFIEAVEELSMKPQKLSVKGNKEYTLYLADKAQIFFTTRQEVSKTVEHLRSVVEKNSFTVGVKYSPLRLEYIDLRYDKNIFYKMKDAESTQ